MVSNNPLDSGKIYGTMGFYILSLHVDDVLLARNNMKIIIAAKGWLSYTFEMKDMGEANYVLRVKIPRVSI